MSMVGRVFTAKDIMAEVVRFNVDICGVYGIRNVVNNKWYVGSSKHILRRWCVEHISPLRRGKHHNNPLENAWNKYGEESFEFVVIEECPENVRAIRENVWMENYRSLVGQSGYNLKTADPENIILSEEAKAAHRRSVSTPEYKAKMSAAQMGHEMSKETRDKISAAHMGLKQSKETKDKRSASHMGKKHSEEHNIRQRAAMNTSEYKDKMSALKRAAWKTPEYVAKVMAAHTPEYVAKMRKPKSEKAKAAYRAAWVLRKLKKRILLRDRKG